MVGQPRFHSGCDAQTAMDATEVLIRKVNRQRKFEIVKLLAKRIGQAREASQLHPHGQVLSFHKTGRDVSETRIADSHLDITSMIGPGEYRSFPCWP